MADKHVDLEALIDSALNEIKTRYQSDNGPENEGLESSIIRNLPEDFNYEVDSLVGSPEKFKFKSSSSDITTESLNGWLVEFETINNVSLKIKTVKKPTKGFLLQNYYRCHHNTRKWSPSKDPQRKLVTNPTARVKNTNCPFQMAVKINTSNVCTIDIDWEHNHSICTLETSNYKDLSPQCIENINKLYEAGHTPSSARHHFMKELRTSCSDEMTYHMKKADRSITPRRRDFSHLYTKYTKERFGGHQEGMFEKLVEKLGEYKQANPEATIDYQLYADDNTPLIVSLVTPLMKRVHKDVEQSGELIFVDSTSNTEEHNLKICLLCTHSVAGALPCGLLITSDEKESTLKQGFSMLKNCLPDYAFHGSGPSVGPKVMLTDNCQEERNALKDVWPSVNLLLCIFHILQQTWRWLVDKNHQVSQDARTHILSIFKNALYAGSEDVFEDYYSEILCDEIAEAYPKAIAYFEGLYEDRQSFALCFRTSLLVRGNQTNNFVESQFLVLKDIILGRVKEYNVVALFDRLTIDLEDHYKEKLLSVADGSFDGHYRRRFMGRKKEKCDGGQGFKVPSEDIQKKFLETVQQFPNSIFQVCSVSEEDKCYTVDMTIGTCSCEGGKDGSPCKHQYMLWAAKMANCINFVPIASPEIRQNLVNVAIGKALPLQYYTTLRDPHQPEMDATAAPRSEAITEAEDCEVIACNGSTCDDAGALDDINVAQAAVTEACQLICAKLASSQDNNLAKGMMQFAQRVKKLASSMHGNLTSGLFNFGTNELSKGKNGKKIKVQPNRKRKSGNGSRQVVGKGRPVTFSALELPAKRAKRDHSFAQSVRQNVNMAKKSGSHVMKSKRKR